MNAPHPSTVQLEAKLTIACGDGVQSSAHVAGPAGVPRLVMIHGNGLAIGGYRRFWSLLTDAFQVVVFDMRGHGRSDAGSSLRHTWPQFYDDLEALYQQIDTALGAVPTFGVFHSLSAVATLGQSRRYGSRWNGLVRFDPPLMPPDGHPLQALHLRDAAVLTERTRQRRRQSLAWPVMWNPEPATSCRSSSPKRAPASHGTFVDRICRMRLPRMA